MPGVSWQSASVLISSVNKHLMSSYYVSGSVPGPGTDQMEKARPLLLLQETRVFWGSRDTASFQSTQRCGGRPGAGEHGGHFGTYSGEMFLQLVLKGQAEKEHGNEVKGPSRCKAQRRPRAGSAQLLEMPSVAGPSGQRVRRRRGHGGESPGAGSAHLPGQKGEGADGTRRAFRTPVPRR